VAAQLLQCSAANQSVSQQRSIVSAANTAQLSSCFTTLQSHIHYAQCATDNLQTSTKHLSNLGYEDCPYRQRNGKTHHWTNNTANSPYGKLAPCNYHHHHHHYCCCYYYYIIIIITNHLVQNPFSLKEEAPNLSQHNVSNNTNKTGEQPVQWISSLGLYLWCLHFRFKWDLALKQFYSKFLCLSLLITILPLLLLLSLSPEMCTDLTRQHVTRFGVFKLGTSSHCCSVRKLAHALTITNIAHRSFLWFQATLTS
jgi:hypothetical protein